MAMSYQNFASLGVNLNRQKYGPLDISNVFTSAADLKYYLTKGAYTEGVSTYWYKNANEKVVPYPYEGQVLATVIDGVVSVYALSLDAEGNFQTQEIGAKIETDDKTIKLVDGKLELVGLPTDTAGKTYVPSYVNGVLTWAEPDTSTAEGQAQEIEGLKTRTTALETTINGKAESSEGAGDAVVGLVAKVAALEAVDNATQAELDAYKEVVTAAIAAGVKEAKDYADENDADTIYDDSALAARVKAIEDDYLTESDKYDDTAIKGRVDTLESVVGDAENGLVKSVAANTKAISDMDAAYKQADTDTLTAAKTYTDEEIAGLTVSIEQKEGVEYIVVKDKAGNEVTSANASKFVQDSFLNDVSYDPETGKVTFTWIMGDGTTKTDEIEISHLVDTYTAGNGLTVTDNEFAIDTAVVATVESLNAVSAVANAAQTAEQVTAAIEAAFTEADLSQYAVKSDVENALEAKLNVSDYNTDKDTFALKADVSSTFAGYYTKTEIDGKGYAIATEVASTYATKADLTTHEETFQNELLAYAKTADVNAELVKKIESGSIAHSSDTLAEGVTVNGTQLNIVVDAYTKQEVRDYVADVIEDMTGGESAADVLLALNNHIATYEEKVGQIDTKNNEQDTAIATAKSQADKGVADAAKVAGDLAALDARVVSNTNEIAAVKGTITTVNETLSGKIATLEAKDVELAGLITGLDTTVQSHSTTIGEHTAAITALQNKDTELAGLISANGTEIAKKANAADVYTKIDTDALLALKANATDVYTKGEVDNLLATLDQSELENAIAANSAAITANATEIATLIGSDKGEDGKANKSVRAIAKEEVALIVGTAPEALDTLQEVAEWIANDESGAAAMAADINAHKAILAGFGTGEGETATVKGYVDASIAAIPEYVLGVATADTLGGVKSASDITVTEGESTITKVAENKVYVNAESGVGEVKAVNVNTLIQTEGDILVLNGGSATV